MAVAPTTVKHLPYPQESLVAFLSRPESYPERPERVEVVQTHISYVFLTDRHAYKLKKPVRMQFLDFSTIEQRRAACEEELRRNQRLARGVYLKVVPVVRGPRGALRLGTSTSAPTGEIIDWLVKMRRLPAHRMLDQLSVQRQISEADDQRLIEVLVPFYRDAPPLVLPVEQYRMRLEEHVLANRDELLTPRHGLSSDLVRRVHAAQLWALHSVPEIFDCRVSDGRIVDGHGDLRPEHICLESNPVVFDCVEFNAEFRVVDVLDELSFLAMELQRLGTGHVGERILRAYQEAAQDWPDPRLVPFYMSYRACVRAKVAVLRAAQASASEGNAQRLLAQQYLSLAEGQAAGFCGMFLVLLRGLSGTGKSTLARELANTLRAERISTDDLRREIFGASPAPAAYGQGVYSDEARGKVYQNLFQQAQTCLSEGRSAVLDGSFLARAPVEQAVQLASALGARLLVVECECPEDVAAQRIERRRSEGRDTSEARVDLRAQQRAACEELPAHLPRLRLNTAQRAPYLVDQVARALRQGGIIRPPPST